MFKRATGTGRNEDEFIDIGERLAPYADADLRPEARKPVAAAAVTSPAHARDAGPPVAPLHLAK